MNYNYIIIVANFIMCHHGHIFFESSVHLHKKMKGRLSLKTEPFCDVTLSWWVNSFCCLESEVKGTLIFEIS